MWLSILRASQAGDYQLFSACIVVLARHAVDEELNLRARVGKRNPRELMERTLTRDLYKESEANKSPYVCGGSQMRIIMTGRHFALARHGGWRTFQTLCLSCVENCRKGEGYSNQ